MYDRDATNISKGALVELCRALSQYCSDKVLAGGWAPYFLVRRYFDHCGSVDIDFVLRPRVMVLNPLLSPELKIKLTKIAEKKRIKVVSFDDAPPKLRGAIYEEFLAERHPTIRWNFRWENYVVVGVPDGITDEFVYEFKTTGSEFLLGYIERSALAQGDLYGYFFRRKNKRVQVYVVDEKETVTWHEEVNEANAVSLLKAFKQLDETHEFSLPEKWKCNRCDFKGQCKLKSPLRSEG